MEREEVFRLKRVKQKKELEKERDKEKWLKAKAEKEAASKPDNRGDPPTPKKLETKSPGGSKSVVNRPPETVNLLILNPRDDLDPTSVGSTFISPFGGKTIPGISQVEELYDDKDRSRLESVLNSTEGESKVDGTNVVSVSKQKLTEVQKLNEPARDLVQEITKGGFENVEGSKNKGIEDPQTGRSTDNVASNAISVSETSLKLAPKDTPGYTEDSKNEIGRVKENTDITNTVQNALYNDIQTEKDTLATVSQTLVPATKSESIKNIPSKGYITTNTLDAENTEEEIISEVKGIKGTTDLKPDLTTSNVNVWVNDNSNGEYSAAQIVDENIVAMDTQKQELSNITRDEDFKVEQNLNTPANILVSEVTKGLVSNKDDIKIKKDMKDAETMHDVSISTAATQYEDMEIEKVQSKREPKFYTDSGINTGKGVKNNTQDESKDDWEFVLANDKQGDDVDTKAAINEIKESTNKEISKYKISDGITSNKQLRILDSDISVRSSRTIDESDNDDDKTDEGEGKKKKKKRKKEKNIHSPDKDPTNDRNDTGNVDK